jgi:hypothetical protein
LFYLFGGEYESKGDVQPFNTLWLYDVIYNTWNRSHLAQVQSQIQELRTTTADTSPTCLCLDGAMSV